MLLNNNSKNIGIAFKKRSQTDIIQRRTKKFKYEFLSINPGHIK